MKILLKPVVFILLTASLGITPVFAVTDTAVIKALTEDAEQGDVEAQYNLGAMYAVGDGIEQDDAKAVVWFQKAADQGDASAPYNLGIMYDHGRGVEKDDRQAAKWYRKAAEQGVAYAQYNLANMYANGRGVIQDDVKAVE